ncbi:MAG: dUTPase [Christensenellaceae bacterium]|jgi:dimeric dUTPase (all-alpha-NTP-PPase superfamily)|nr:dUTPase [Christensenellaceae bacterium]
MSEIHDKFDVIFELQKRFDNEIVEKRGLEGITPDEWIQKEVLAMLSELSELLDEVNFKWWKNKKEINYDNVKEELIDILHFFVSSCIKVGMTSKETYLRYIEKNKENFKRQYGESKKLGYELSEMLSNDNEKKKT